MSYPRTYAAVCCICTVSGDCRPASPKRNSRHGMVVAWFVFLCDPRARSGFSCIFLVLLQENGGTVGQLRQPFYDRPSHHPYTSSPIPSWSANCQSHCGRRNPSLSSVSTVISSSGLPWFAGLSVKVRFSSLCCPRPEWVMISSVTDSMASLHGRAATYT